MLHIYMELFTSGTNIIDQLTNQRSLERNPFTKKKRIGQSGHFLATQGVKGFTHEDYTKKIPLPLSFLLTKEDSPATDKQVKEIKKSFHNFITYL